MHPRTLSLANWFLSRLAPQAACEPLVGDLMEEYALRAKAGPPSAALKWYVQQVCASTPPLLWARLTRAAWISTIGVALLAYIAVGVVELVVRWTISTQTAVYDAAGMMITFPMVVLIGYFAARLRRGAPIVLATMMLLAVTVMTLTANEVMPLWYRIAYFIVGPAAAFLGSALRSHQLTRPQG